MTHYSRVNFLVYRGLFQILTILSATVFLLEDSTARVLTQPSALHKPLRPVPLPFPFHDSSSECFFTAHPERERFCEPRSLTQYRPRTQNLFSPAKYNLFSLNFHPSSSPHIVTVSSTLMEEDEFRNSDRSSVLYHPLSRLISRQIFPSPFFCLTWVSDIDRRVLR